MKPSGLSCFHTSRPDQSLLQCGLAVSPGSSSRYIPAASVPILFIRVPDGLLLRASSFISPRKASAGIVDPVPPLSPGSQSSAPGFLKAETPRSMHSGVFRVYPGSFPAPGFLRYPADGGTSAFHLRRAHVKAAFSAFMRNMPGQRVHAFIPVGHQDAGDHPDLQRALPQKKDPRVKILSARPKRPPGLTGYSLTLCLFSEAFPPGPA